MRPTFIVLCVAVMAMSTSCVSKKKFDELTEERNRLAQNLEETQRQIKSLQEEQAQMTAEFEKTKGELDGKITSLQSEVDAAKKDAANAQGMLAEKDKKINSLTEAIDATFNAYESSGLTLEEVNDNIFLKTNNPVLFSSGSIVLDKTDLEVIDQLAAILKNNPNLEVIVEGHTDNKQMVEGAAYRDNWDLSYRRADAVVRRLMKAGVSASQLASSARSEYNPLMEDQKTAEARNQNRRVVFRIAPKMSALYDASKAK